MASPNITALKYSAIAITALFLTYSLIFEYVLLWFVFFTILVAIEKKENIPFLVFTFTCPIFLLEQIIELSILDYVSVSFFYLTVRKMILVYLVFGVAIIFSAVCKYLLHKFRNKSNEQIPYNSQNKNRYLIKNIISVIALSMILYSYVYFNAHRDNGRVKLYYEIVSYYSFPVDKLYNIINNDATGDKLLAFLVLSDKTNIDELKLIIDNFCDNNVIEFCKGDQLLNVVSVQHEVFRNWELSTRKYSATQFMLPIEHRKIIFTKNMYKNIFMGS